MRGPGRRWVVARCLIAAIDKSIPAIDSEPAQDAQASGRPATGLPGRQALRVAATSHRADNAVESGPTNRRRLKPLRPAHMARDAGKVQRQHQGLQPGIGGVQAGVGGLPVLQSSSPLSEPASASVASDCQARPVTWASASPAAVAAATGPGGAAGACPAPLATCARIHCSPSIVPIVPSNCCWSYLFTGYAQRTQAQPLPMALPSSTPK